MAERFNRLASSLGIAKTFKAGAEMNIDVLIATIPDDIHAAAVSVALEHYGCSVGRWYPSGYPLTDEITFSTTGTSQPKWSIDLASRQRLTFPDDQVGTFWYRRQGSPTLSEQLHPADMNFALRTCERATDSAFDFVSGIARLSVNPFAHALSVERSKMLQLQTAIKCGLRCPKTIFTNEPARIRTFIDGHPSGVIFKSLLFVTWEGAEGIATNYTSPVNTSDLPCDEILRSSPGIFQENVLKDCEIRVTVMGNHVVAARLDSQTLTDCTTDWRVRGPSVPVSGVDLPPEIHHKCLALMRSLGLVFGCIDLILTPEGEYVFLEVNQQGQFLWIEEGDPSLKLLDTFAQFLAAAEPAFAGPRTPPRVSFESVRNDAYQILEEDMRGYEMPIDSQTNIIRE